MIVYAGMMNDDDDVARNAWIKYFLHPDLIIFLLFLLEHCLESPTPTKGPTVTFTNFQFHFIYSVHKFIYLFQQFTGELLPCSGPVLRGERVRYAGRGGAPTTACPALLVRRVCHLLPEKHC